MQAFVAALLAGPQWQPPRAAGRGRTLAALPLLALALGVAAACLDALASSHTDRPVRSVLHVLVPAAMATVLCLGLAVPASLSRPGAGWLALGWLALYLGAAGWSVAALPPTALGSILARAVLLVPVMAIGLGAAWSGLPGGTWRTASSLGARWPAILLAVLAVRWPAILRSCLVVMAAAVALSLV